MTTVSARRANNGPIRISGENDEAAPRRIIEKSWLKPNLQIAKLGGGPARGAIIP
jgi:hypothetical protein